MDVAISGSTPAVEQETIKLVACGDAGLFEAASRIFDAFGLMSCSRERQKPRLDGTRGFRSQAPASVTNII